MENGSPKKNATLIYLTVILQYREIFYLIVGIPLVLCRTFVGKSLQVYLVLEKSFNFKPTIFKFLHDDYCTTSLYEHPSTSTAGFPSSGQSLQSLQKQLREHRTLSTHPRKYTVVQKITKFLQQFKLTQPGTRHEPGTFELWRDWPCGLSQLPTKQRCFKELRVDRLVSWSNDSFEKNP